MYRYQSPFLVSKDLKAESSDEQGFGIGNTQLPNEQYQTIPGAS